MTDTVDFDVTPTGIEGMFRLTMKQVTDDRGTVRELYRESAVASAGLAALGPWVQVNVTETRRGAIRGMHGEDLTKLVAVVAGEAHGAYVDTRTSSRTFGVVEQIPLVVGVQVLVPAGVCNGFQALADGTHYLYCFDREWTPGMAGTAVSPLDPDLGIDWPVPIDPDDPALLSAKDRNAPRLYPPPA